MQYSLEDIQNLHKKYAPSNEVYEEIFQHCQIVWEIAEQLITKNNLHVDKELVWAGALLHDIGAYALFKEDGTPPEKGEYVRHGIEGEKILRAEGFPEELCRIPSHHTGVGIPKEQILSRNMPLPPQDYFAETDEELLVMYADKFHSKLYLVTFNSFDWYREYVGQYGGDMPAKFDAMAEKFGKPDLSKLSATYGFAIR